MEKHFEERKKHVASFVTSYFMHKKMEEVSGFYENGDFSTTVKPVEKNPFDEELEAGQIRLLADTERITYVALLKRWGDDAFIVMPFSRYNSPATDEELKTNFDGGLYLRVLQAWNTRTLQDTTLKKSWCIGTLPQNDLDDAWTMWEATIADVTLSDDILQRTGLPIYRKQDPRLKYKREELVNFARIDAEDLALLETVPATTQKNTITLWKLLDRRSAALAAGDEKNNLAFNLEIAEPKATIFIEYSQHDKRLFFDVYDANGAPTTMLDGCIILDAADDRQLGVIQNGHADMPYDSASCAIRILDKDGQPLDATVKSEDDNA